MLSAFALTRALKEKTNPEKLVLKIEMFELQGKVCLVTGSAGGIGLELVKLFLQKGAKCLMVDVNYRVSQPVPYSIAQ